MEVVFDLHAIDGGDGREGFLELFEGVGCARVVQVGENEVLFGDGWEGFGCLQWGMLLVECERSGTWWVTIVEKAC